MNEVVVRPGTRQDVPGLLALIRELAAYERAPDEVEVTEEELERDGFGPEKVFGFQVAELNGAIIGIALYYTKYSTWKCRCIYLEDIVVSEAHRRQGVGMKLFEAVRQVATRQRVKRLEWQVLEWNEPAIRFYRKIGAELDGEWINCKLREEDIRTN